MKCNVYKFAQNNRARTDHIPMTREARRSAWWVAKCVCETKRKLLFGMHLCR